MKNNLIYKLLGLVLLFPMLMGCSKEEITFDIEQPQFELREGYQLLEVIVPRETLPGDKLYIVGPFNGGAEMAVGDPRWELEKAPAIEGKYGIYLNPADFVDGKTLADGYTFVNVPQGEERSLDDKPVTHTEAPAIGGRINVMVYRWAEYFKTPVDPGEITHDGYVIYVVDNSGYDALAMYAWGDSEAFGGWPGIAPTGTVEKDGVSYKYFDTGAVNEGQNLNLIFNNNGGGQQLPDYNVTLNQDFYLELTPDGVNEFDPNNTVQHDGYAIFVADFSGWDELYLYMWGTVNDLNGAWPGMAPTGEQIINGVTYKYFDLGAANCDGSMEEHLILNNNSGKQFDDVVVFNLDRDVYLELTPDGATEIDPATYVPTVNPDDPDDPDDPTVPAGNEYQIYVKDNTGWDALYIYAWGDEEAFGAWPGRVCDTTATIAGETYMVWNVRGTGQTLNLIFNNNNDAQYDAATIVLDKDYFIGADPTGPVFRPRQGITRFRR